MPQIVRAWVQSGGRSDRGYFSCRIAQRFQDRLIGLIGARLRYPTTALLLPACRAVHSFGMCRPFQLVFLDASYRVLVVHDHVLPWRVVVCRRAVHVLESYQKLLLRPGDQIRFSNQQLDYSPRGFSAIETLIALPILLMLVFSVVQIGLLWHAKFAISHAAMVAARHASVNHGNQSAIRDGLVQGLMPLLSKSQRLSDMTTALFRSGTELAVGLSSGWIYWEIISPTRQSFSDWGRPADVTDSPDASRNDIEIPSSPMPALATRLMPRSGVKQWAGGLPVGSDSGQTLVDANTLKLFLKVGIPLSMPIAGKLLARSLALWSGCGWQVTNAHDRVGLVNFGHGVNPTILSPSIECRALAARDLHGNWKPRWPVAAAAVVTMQSNARQSVMQLRDRQHDSVTH